MAAPKELSRVGCDVGVEHMGISSRPSFCWVLHAAVAGANSRFLRSAPFWLTAALIGSLTLFVAKTRVSCGNVVDSYTPTHRRACTSHALGLERNLHVVLNLRTVMFT